ncbi:hypothetical protein FACS1894132_12580 [Clostridia bacterium]|nr:hypothetical protein FACS1894132_12580 [Clostridia bacterium]
MDIHSKNKFIFKTIMSLVLIILFFSSCINTSISRKLDDFPNSKWSCEEYSIHFVYCESGGTYGEWTLNGVKIPVVFEFSMGGNVDINDLALGREYSNYHYILLADAQLKGEKFILTPMNVYDDRFDFLKGKEITFTREQLTEEEALKMWDEIIEKYGLMVW